MVFMFLLRYFLVAYASVVLSDASNVVLNWGTTKGNLGIINITVGDSVTWVWSESKEHSVMSTSIDNPFQNSDVVSVLGYRYQVNFTAPGHYTYQCSIHNAMKGAINVIAAFEPTSIPSLRPTVSMSPTHSQSPTTFVSMSPTLAPSISPYPTQTLPTSSPTMTHNPTTSPSAVPTTFTGMPSTEPTSSPTSITDLLGRQITYPRILSSSYNRPRNWFLTLYIREHRHHAGPVSFTTRSVCYFRTGSVECSYPGPTIRCDYTHLQSIYPL